MPRYLIERTFADGLTVPLTDEGERMCRTINTRNARYGVHWLHSYVSADRTRTFCVYDGPTPESIHQAAECNGLPVDRVTAVCLLAPHFYRP